ncbi:MAG: DNA primase DnaG [Candidatus Hadarchaeales archaeon]
MEEKKLEAQIAERLGEKKEESHMQEEIGTAKYLIKARLEASGVVERPDDEGEGFGQTEGLLGEELDLRELLKRGRIGRVKVDLKTEQGKTTGTIFIPSRLDRVETAIIAAALETIERIGPCEAKIAVEEIRDLRDKKRKYVMERAKEILQKFEELVPESQEITELVKDTIKAEDISDYHGLPAGPGLLESDAIIVVEGRADVLNLLRAGIKNTIAVEGTNVPKAVADLTKDKIVTAFLDNDRGGDLILKELLQVAKIDFVARPPPGRSVEELTKKEIMKALKDKVPVEVILAKERKAEHRESPDEMAQIKRKMEELQNTLKGVLLDENFNQVVEVPVNELRSAIEKHQGVRAIVFDGIVTQDLVDAAASAGIRYLAGARSRAENIPRGLRVITFADFRRR